MMSKHLLRLLIRVAFYPTLGINRLLCACGMWRRWDWIDHHVLLGALPSRRNLNQLAGAGVAAVVNLCEEFAGHDKLLSALGLTQLRLPTLDYHPPHEDHLVAGVNFIRKQIEQGKKVYLHCKAGRGRSATLALCYLMVARQLGAAEAYQQLKALRPQVDRGLHCRREVQAIERRVQAGEWT